MISLTLFNYADVILSKRQRGLSCLVKAYAADRVRFPKNYSNCTGNGLGCSCKCIYNLRVTNSAPNNARSEQLASLVIPRCASQACSSNTIMLASPKNGLSLSCSKDTATTACVLNRSRAAYGEQSTIRRFQHVIRRLTASSIYSTSSRLLTSW